MCIKQTAQSKTNKQRKYAKDECLKKMTKRCVKPEVFNSLGEGRRVTNGIEVSKGGPCAG